MPQSRAITKYVRISPRKARLAADLIRGLHVPQAFAQLGLCGAKAGPLLRKTLKSAVANAECEYGVRPDSLWVKIVLVNEGPTHKRSKSKCRGGSAPILKRTSHFVVVVGTQEGME